MYAYRLDFKKGDSKTVVAYDMQEAIEFSAIHERAMRDGGNPDVYVKGVHLIGEALDRNALRHYADSMHETTGDSLEGADLKMAQRGSEVAVEKDRKQNRYGFVSEEITSIEEVDDPHIKRAG